MDASSIAQTAVPFKGKIAICFEQATGETPYGSEKITAIDLADPLKSHRSR